MIAVLAGGVGAARLLRGLVRVVDADGITVIVNVGDDLDLVGLRICPDLDSITYWLAGLVHPDQQWGRADETFTVAGELARFGHEPWFTLGDRDLALHLQRAQGLAQGLPLSVVTDAITSTFGVATRLIPATDDRVETRIHTRDGRDLHFQEYWVRERAAPEVARIEHRGAADALPAPWVVEALMDADAVIVAPSNPAVSIAPILAIPGVRAAVATTTAPVVGVSPVIGGRVVRGMADRLLPALGVEVRASAIAAHYGHRRDGGILDAWVMDDEDAADTGAVEALGIATTTTTTLLDDVEVAAALAARCLELAGRVDGART